MKRQSLFLWNAALLLSVIGFGVVSGKDPPKLAEKGADSAPAKETTKAKAKPKTEATPIAEPTQSQTNSQPANTKRSVDEAAILETGETYLKAFGKADAKSIAALYTADAEYVDEQGNVYEGREAIEGAMTTLFAENPGCQMELEIQTIRFVTADVAVEDGTTLFTASVEDEPVYSHYTAVHVKVNGKWLAASVREHAPKDRRQHRAQLKQLAWLQGDWVDEEDENSVVLFSCKSVDGGNFLLRTFVIQVAGQEAMSGTQRIGWDPLTGKLRAWIFDSEGGFSDGLWHRDEDRWVLKSVGATADGQPASSTSIYTLVNDHTMTWQSVNHEVAGVQLPNSEKVTIVRRAPSPEQADDASLSKSK